MTFDNTTFTSLQGGHYLYFAVTQELASLPPNITSTRFIDVVADPESPKLDHMENAHVPTELASTSIDNIMQIDPVSPVSELKLIDLGHYNP